MFYDEHNPPHFHADYQGNKAVFDLNGNVLKGDIKSKTARKLIREWVDLHTDELMEDWDLARNDKEIKKIHRVKPAGLFNKPFKSDIFWPKNCNKQLLKHL